MPIIVHSPFSGQEVKIRDEDVGRAVRDEENRIFYVLERSDGTGHYGAPTRAGNVRDELRYDELVAKIAKTRQSGRDNSVRQIHDARGKPRASLMGRLILLIFVLLLAAGAYAYFTGKLNSLLGGNNSSPLPVQPMPAPAAPTLPETTPPVPTSMHFEIHLAQLDALIYLPAA